MAAVDMFLKLDGVDGESTDEKHKNEIQLTSFSWGESNPGSLSSAGGGAGAGKTVAQDFHFTTPSSKASPLLMMGCANGKRFAFATLSVVSGRFRDVFYKIKLTNVLISSYQTGGAEAVNGNDQIPQDQVALNFARIDFEWRSQSPTGVQLPPVVGSWDFYKNTT